MVTARPRTKQQLLTISQIVPAYPASSQRVTKLAMSRGFDPAVIKLLRLFPRDVTFSGPDDLLTRCEEVDLLQSEVKEMPAEPALSRMD